MKFRIPRGTQDLLPGEVEKWQYVEEKAKELCRRYHFSEVRTPVFEQTSLFQRGVGETTDIVEKEMYTFEDRGGRSLTLRPEGTASVVRSFVENKLYADTPPTKLYYIGPMFRYERPQAGRQRQFHQFGVEVFGTEEPDVDAEIIDLGYRFYRATGLADVKVELNSVGCPRCRPVHREALVEYLTPHKEELCKDCQSRLERNPMRILDCKNESCHRITEGAPKVIDFLCDHCGPHFDSVKEALELLEVPFHVNTRLVRGLDYYTQTAFEFVLEGKGGGSLGGGGRYNGLVEEVGGPETPGIGFAVGLERVLMALEQQEVELPLQTGVDCFLVTLGAEAKKHGVTLLKQLREAGLSAERDYLDRKMKGQMKAADRARAAYVAILGENELAENRVKVKNLATGDQETIQLDKLVDYIRDVSK
ncbi:histidyl-tRNA synthetase [Melghirimyces thermohalophilus]|uniref:Histidine--tRNA ligase n=1 Tax=Melghirimyces thermohalophilus TaxID=1236220 RepID=A0A1G6N1R9_9BACL|nr:histidine--tRNA ligase [Melghirimyces thermohalophilus]SDC61414.1 histidyl-tRNA synthetase [Melghirimyces thermohalophilus]